MESRTPVGNKGTLVVNCATGTTELGGALQITNRGMGRVGVIRPEGLRRGAVTRVSDPSN